MSDIITVTGNIATPPEHKRTPSGLLITTFRLASGQRVFDKQTETWIDGETNWYTVSTFRGLAEHAFDSLRKGERVILTGRLRLREWETETKKGWTAEIDADAIGHDLLFGTTRFQRAAGAPATAPSAPTANGQWSVPGTESSVLAPQIESPEMAMAGDVPF